MNREFYAAYCCLFFLSIPITCSTDSPYLEKMRIQSRTPLEYLNLLSLFNLKYLSSIYQVDFDSISTERATMGRHCRGNE